MSYTYFDRKKVRLIASKDTFVSRAPRVELERAGFQIIERLSPNSYRIATTPRRRAAEIQRARAIGPAFPDYSVPNGKDSPAAASDYRMTDRVFVRFKRKPTVAERQALMKRYGMKQKKNYGGNRYLMQIVSRVDPTAVVRDLVEHAGGVERAEHDLNHVVVPMQIEIPTADPNYAAQWHLHDVVDDRFVPVSSIRCENAWRHLDGFGNPRVVICVTDGAFDIDHPDLEGEKVVGWAYFDENKQLIDMNNPAADRRRLAEGPPSLINHGTVCAGLAAASINRRHAVGVAPACKLYLVKFRNDGVGSSIVSDGELLTMIQHVRTRVDVVTSSWGSIDPIVEWNPDAMAELDDAALNGGRRRRKGVVFVWAGGNSNRPLARQFVSSVPVPYERKTTKTASVFVNNLVGRPNVLHVAASTSRAMRAHYSNYGPGIDLAAPSGNEHFFDCDLNGSDGLPIRSSGFNGRTANVDSEFNGTSASAPIVAGVAALVVSAAPGITAAETIQILKRTAERGLNFTPYPRAGCINPEVIRDVSPVDEFRAGEFKPTARCGEMRSHWFGFGRVDALKAVSAAKERKRKQRNRRGR